MKDREDFVTNIENAARSKIKAQQSFLLSRIESSTQSLRDKDASFIHDTCIKQVGTLPETPLKFDILQAVYKGLTGANCEEKSSDVILSNIQKACISPQTRASSGASQSSVKAIQENLKSSKTNPTGDEKKSKELAELGKQGHVSNRIKQLTDYFKKFNDSNYRDSDIYNNQKEKIAKQISDNKVSVEAGKVDLKNFDAIFGKAYGDVHTAAMKDITVLKSELKDLSAEDFKEIQSLAYIYHASLKSADLQIQANFEATEINTLTMNDFTPKDPKEKRLTVEEVTDKISDFTRKLEILQIVANGLNYSEEFRENLKKITSINIWKNAERHFRERSLEINYHATKPWVMKAYTFDEFKVKYANYLETGDKTHTPHSDNLISEYSGKRKTHKQVEKELGEGKAKGLFDKLNQETKQAASADVDASKPKTNR